MYRYTFLGICTVQQRNTVAAEIIIETSYIGHFKYYFVRF